MSPYQNHATMQGHIAKWQASDLTQSAYCKEYGIKPHIFSYYKKKFCPNSAVTKHPSQLVPVKLVADDAPLVSNLSSSSGSGVLRLAHANGFSLEINLHEGIHSNINKAGKHVFQLKPSVMAVAEFGQVTR